MLRYMIAGMVSLVLAGYLPPMAAQARDSCTRIEFTRGKSSATVRGMAESENFKCYTLETNAGQTATVKLVGRAQDDTAFNIDGVVDNQALVTFKTDAKTYRIDVYRTFARERPIPFTISVSVR